MLLVIDANEYLFAFGLSREANSEELLRQLAERPPGVSFRISRLIVDEAYRNLTPEAFKEFILFIIKQTTIDEDSEIPFELGARYEAKGLKPADALIAA